MVTIIRVLSLRVNLLSNTIIYKEVIRQDFGMHQLFRVIENRIFIQDNSYS